VEHWLIAVVAPFVELNPVKYAFKEAYRISADVRLGRRARRIFFYQIFVLILAILIIVFWGMVGLDGG